MDYNLLISIISIIISGLMSLFISRHYYNKANKDMMLRIIKPTVVDLAAEKFGFEKYYDELASLKDHVEVMYLDKSDIETIIQMSDAISKLRKNTSDRVHAEAIVEIFIDKFEKKGIDLKIVPFTTPDGELIDYDYVPEIDDLYFAAERIAQKYDDLIIKECEQELNYEKTLRNQMNYFASLINDDVRFDDMNILKAIAESKAVMKYENMKKEVIIMIKDFLNLKICKDMVCEDKTA